MQQRRLSMLLHYVGMIPLLVAGIQSLMARGDPLELPHTPGWQMLLCVPVPYMVFSLSHSLSFPPGPSAVLAVHSDQR